VRAGQLEVQVREVWPAVVDEHAAAEPVIRRQARPVAAPKAVRGRAVPEGGREPFNTSFC
jgi:hypothetical protein